MGKLEVMRGLDDMVRAGKVLYVGISDTPAWIVAQANTLAQVHGWTPFVGLQIEYSLRRSCSVERTPPLIIIADKSNAALALRGSF
ncbi:MAG TPA: aldo/keto reductase [Terrimicrobiaceae bacterium]